MARRLISLPVRGLQQAATCKTGTKQEIKGCLLAGHSVATTLVLAWTGHHSIVPQGSAGKSQDEWHPAAAASGHFQPGRLTRDLLEQILVTLLVQSPHGGELGFGLRRAPQALIDLRQAVVRVGSGGIQPYGLAEFPGSGLILFVAGM